MYFVYLSFRLCVCFACDVSCGLLVSNRIFDVTCQSLIKDEKKNTPQLFSTRCRQWNLGFDLSHCKKKICTSKCLKLLIVFGWYQDVPNRFLLTSEEFRLTIETPSEFEDWMSMTLMFYFLNRKYPQFLFYNSFGKNIISKLYPSWLLLSPHVAIKSMVLDFE